ncbi:MAG: acyl-CoA thioester hydrolase [Arenicella sp.]|jgi:acyl-CoA thioester hydrolase
MNWAKQDTKVISCCIDREIAFYDVDSYRIVWHGNYPKYFEEARCALLEQVGYPYAAMEESTYFFPVIDLQIRYIKTIVFKQRIKIAATLTEWEHRLVIRYLISDADSGERLCKGSTTQVAVKMPEQITQYESPAELINKVQEFLQQ